MKPIFNSLGSNYSFSYSLYALQQAISPSTTSIVKLQQKLADEFGGQAYLFYKGRDAIEYCLQALGIGAGDSVITQAFTCFAIEEAITRTGAVPEYVDLDRESLQPSIKTLNQSFKHKPGAKAVLIQHSLGYPADIEAIRDWCSQHHLFLIEDLAQAYGGVDTHKQPLGTLADAIILSFGRDKILDAVSGGGCVIKVPHRDINSLKDNAPSPTADMVYPLLTQAIRGTHRYGIGKALHKLATATGLMKNPIYSPTKQPTSLKAAYAALVLEQQKGIDQQIRHRRNIATAYFNQLSDCSLVNQSSIDQGSCLRFPINISQPQQLITALENHHIYIADRWYRKPVDCGSLSCQTAYIPGSCPNAEDLARHIVNLPTHKGITVDDAKRISALVKDYK